MLEYNRAVLFINQKEKKKRKDFFFFRACEYHGNRYRKSRLIKKLSDYVHFQNFRGKICIDLLIFFKETNTQIMYFWFC